MINAIKYGFYKHLLLTLMTHVINLNYDINRDCIGAEEAESIGC